MAKSIRNPRAAKNLILSLFMLNPDKSFTTDEVHEKALDNQYFKEGFLDADSQTRVRSLITGLRKEGFTIDSSRPQPGERARYSLRGRGVQPTFQAVKKAKRKGVAA